MSRFVICDLPDQGLAEIRSVFIEELRRSMRGPLDHPRQLGPFVSGGLEPMRVGTLVIGSGVAGLRAAIEAARVGDVVVLGKSPQESTSTFQAQGGIAVAINEDDSPEQHLADTIAAGAGLCDESVVGTMVRAGLERVDELIDWGMRLDRKADGSLAFGLEAAHSLARVVHSDGDATGRELMRCLIERARAREEILFAERWYAIDLITDSDERGARVMGAVAFHPEQGVRVFLARATILATGGAGDLYRDSSNPGASTGDGIAMAYRAGASVADMAFVQFHPTALCIEGTARHLITEAIRGDGAHLLDDGGHRFMLDEHPMGELAPRDVVSRAIAARMAESGTSHVCLDVRHLDGFGARFPGIAAMLSSVGLNPKCDLIPVAPAAHFTIGGVATDASGRTDLRGLYAVGEVACTGFHGANRLASNSVLEGLVMGAAAVRAAQEDALDEPASVSRAFVASAHGEVGKSEGNSTERGGVACEQRISDLRSLMWSSVGITRTGTELQEAAYSIEAWEVESNRDAAEHRLGWKLRNMLLVAGLITRSALWRTESRGVHWRCDMPEPSDAFACHDVWSKNHVQPTRRPVVNSANQRGPSASAGSVPRPCEY